MQGDASALKRLAVAGTGTGAAVYGDDDDLDDEVGPQPMAKPKEYKEEKHVRDSCSYFVSLSILISDSFVFFSTVMCCDVMSSRALEVR